MNADQFAGLHLIAQPQGAGKPGCGGALPRAVMASRSLPASVAHTGSTSETILENINEADHLGVRGVATQLANNAGGAFEISFAPRISALAFPS
jgi:hypothetical protein